MLIGVGQGSVLILGLVRNWLNMLFVFMYSNICFLEKHIIPIIDALVCNSILLKLYVPILRRRNQGMFVTRWAILCVRLEWGR